MGITNTYNVYNYYVSEEILVMFRCCLSNIILEEAKDVDSRLTESELGRLALKISSKNIRDIGQMHLDYDPDKAGFHRGHPARR